MVCYERERLTNAYLAAIERLDIETDAAGAMSNDPSNDWIQKLRDDCEAALAKLKDHRAAHGCLEPSAR